MNINKINQVRSFVIYYQKHIRELKRVTACKSSVYSKEQHHIKKTNRRSARRSREVNGLFSLYGAFWHLNIPKLGAPSHVLTALYVSGNTELAFQPRKYKQ